MSAQIQLEYTLDGVFLQVPETTKVESLAKQYNILDYYFCIKDQDSYSFYNFDYTLAKTITRDSAYLFAANIFTTDGKITFIEAKKGIYDNYEPFNSVKLYNEDGSMLFDFGTNQWFGIIKIGEQYKFCTSNYDMVNVGEPYWTYVQKNGVTKIYSLPGNGQPTDIDSPTAPARTTNARKVVENGQMYIILDGVKYAVTGSSM